VLNAHLPYLGLKSVTHGYNSRPTATFPATDLVRTVTATKLYCLVTKTHVCEQLAQGCHLKEEWSRFKPATSEL